MTGSGRLRRDSGPAQLLRNAHPASIFAGVNFGSSVWTGNWGASQGARASELHVFARALSKTNSHPGVEAL